MPYSYPSRHSLFSEILGDRLTTSKPHQSSCLHLHSAGVLGLQGVYLVPLWGTCPFIWIWAHSHVCTESALILWASHPDLFSAIPSIGSRLLYGLALVSSPHVIIQLLRSHLFREVCTDCHDRIQIPPFLLSYHPLASPLWHLQLAQIMDPSALCCFLPPPCSFHERKRHLWGVKNNACAVVGVHNDMLNEWMSFGFKGKRGILICNFKLGICSQQ